MKDIMEYLFLYECPCCGFKVTESAYWKVQADFGCPKCERRTFSQFREIREILNDATGRSPIHPEDGA